MSQILSQVPSQLLQQQQRLTPQLIQAMDILQLPMMALESRIAQEIDGNPALELVLPEDEAAEAASAAETEDEPPSGEKALVVEEGNAAEFERLDNLVREYDWIEDDAEYRGTKSRARSLEEGDIKMEAMANTAARPVSLQEYLSQQWSLTEVDEQTRQIGAKIIDFVDENGRLSTPLEEIAREFVEPPSLDQMEQALRAVQRLDPPGIAARNLREYLLLQLEALPGDTSLERKIIERHLEDLQKNRLPQIARALGVDLSDAPASLRGCRAPGLKVVSQPGAADRARRDRGLQREGKSVEVYCGAMHASYGFRRNFARHWRRRGRTSGRAISLNRRSRPTRSLMGATAASGSWKWPRRWWRLNAIFDYGEQHLKVLRMSDLARFGCDPSTISRTVDESTCRAGGVFPLRGFSRADGVGQRRSSGVGQHQRKVQEIVARKTNGIRSVMTRSSQN